MAMWTFIGSPGGNFQFEIASTATHLPRYIDDDIRYRVYCKDSKIGDDRNIFPWTFLESPIPGVFVYYGIDSSMSIGRSFFDDTRAQFLIFHDRLDITVHSARRI